MKRFGVVLITAALIGGLVSCAPAPIPTRYDLTMAVAPAGSGNATDLTNASPYAEGTIVNIAAVAAVGYQFVNWTAPVGTFANANAARTTFTMPARYATVTANFALKAAEIRTWYDLDAIRDNLGGSYVLMNDLDSITAGYEELASLTANQGKGWEPIGSLLLDPTSSWISGFVDSFTGSLDGQGYEIRDLFIGRPDEDGVGLFGCANEGVIENLGVVNAEVTGRANVGGLAGGFGWNQQGAVSNCYFTGSVTGDTMVGALVGGTWGTVSNSYSSGDVTGTGNVGGLAGGNWHTVSNSYSTGNVTGSWQVGGLVGWNNQGAVSNSYFTGSVSGKWSAGGLVAENHDGTVSNSYYSYDKVLINGRNIITIGALSNEDFEQWLANDKFLNVKERLSQEDGYYLINDVSDFKQLLAFGQNPSLKFRLKNDLDLGTEANFYIPYLAGEFDGNGHKIWNLSFHFDFARQVGLFGYLASTGVVTGVSAENIDITGNIYVGGLVGENDGAVSNSWTTGRVAGYGSVGGLVGWMGWHGGTVSNSYYNYDEVLINNDRRIITIGALSNEDFDQWLANDKFLDVNERLSKEDGYYLINDVSDFKQLLAFGQDDSLKFRLRNDLNLGNHPNFYIPYLAGEFDGNGHKIWNLGLHFDFLAPVGLFGYIGSGGKVSQLGVENVNVTGYQQVGGLVGESVGTVSKSYSTGGVTGSQNIGGLVGYDYCTPENCGTISNSYSSGIVTGERKVGGLMGARGGTTYNSFWDTETSGQATSDGGTGKTTAEMKSITTFSGAGWNIITVANPGTRNPSYTWNIVDGHTYPFLSWQPVS